MGYPSLNAEQLKAVRATRGRVLILAGAGSGKTSTVAYRIAYLIQECDVPQSQILGLTFTNKAAREMQERVGRYIGAAQAKEVTLSTFHSFCTHVLRKEIHHLGFTSDFSLYSEREVRRMLLDLARQALEQEGDIPSVEGILEKIAFAKARGLPPHEEKEIFARTLMEKLEVALRAYNAVDFDSLLTLTVRLFQEFPAVLAAYQERFRYIMVDEYQDTNPIQVQLVELLSAKYGNLCVVGDDDQSIYGWRGAEVKNILRFQAPTVIKLEQNYRSTPTILAAANALIQNNRERHNKQLWSQHAQGDLVDLFHAPTEKEEAEAVIYRIMKYKKEHQVPWSDIAILYRSNILSRPFELALVDAVWEEGGKWQRGIPYQIFGGLEIYERSEVKDLLAYLRAIANPLDQEALLRIINVPRRGISDNALDLLTQLNRQGNLSLWEVLKQGTEKISDRAAAGVRSFVEIIEKGRLQFKKGSLRSGLEWLIDTINYKKAIEEEVKSEKGREVKWENVEACLDAIAHYEKTTSHPSLQDFLATTYLDAQSHRTKESRENLLTLMTFHSAKGLEFRACFLVGLEDHLIPHEKSLKETGLEEERRLLYVALTRAKEKLTLSMARQRKRHGKEDKSNPSRFLFEIPKELLRVGSYRD